jgi:hypothetical protein
VRKEMESNLAKFRARAEGKKTKEPTTGQQSG